MAKAEAPDLKLGLRKTLEKTVRYEWTIAHHDARLPAVLSTPAMIGLMEQAAAEAVWPRLPKGSITVGTRIEVDHLKAAPAGARVRIKARLAEIKGRFLIFGVEASAGRQLIGKGRVFRAIVEPARFFSKARRRQGRRAG
ncbi:MAG TPA: hotdog domain-containing protein [Candidatus Acidoferrales bacterium]|nr:hotdog domain-containing protein [Candidatus Acidoferrales bacterium]